MGRARILATLKLRGQSQAGASTQEQSRAQGIHPVFERSKAWQLPTKATRLDSRKTEQRSRQGVFRRAGTAKAQNP